ncbi:MAG: protein-disulfide reductase DsbD, partial [Caldimonas sp.]
MFKPSRVRRNLIGLLLVASAAAHAAKDAPSPGTAPQSTAATAASGTLDSIRNWFGNSSAPDELLPPEQAFQLTVRAQDADTLIATLTPAKNYYLYRDRISFAIQNPPGVTVDKVSMPRGEIKADATFGDTEVFHRPIDAVIRLGGAGERGKSLELLATYQGCNEPLGVCYPPIEKTVTVAFTGAGPGAAEARSSPNDAARTPTAAKDVASEDGYFHHLFAAGGSWAIVAAFFGFGFLLAFTPCMLPMIPILSGIIVGQGRHLTRRQALGLSTVYVLAMAITYALAGMAAGLAGTLLTAYLQSPWVLGTFAAIFVLLALSMFGFYELQLPAALQSRLTRAGAGIRGGRTIGVFGMGILSALIVGPCVAAPLAGALLYIGQTRDIALGGTALFAMGLGMGVPLLLIGTAAGTLLPKAGAWTKSVSQAFGVAMLALAIYIVSPLLPVVVQMLLWSALLIVPAVFLRAVDPLPADASGVTRLSKGLAMIALVIGIALLIGALSGSRDVLQPLAGIRSAAAPVDGKLAFVRVKNLAELQAQVKEASGRYVMLDFWAEWCVSCKEMERFTFSDARVQARLRDTVLLQADVTVNNADDQALLRRFKLFGPPGIVFFDKQGQER